MGMGMPGMGGGMGQTPHGQVPSGGGAGPSKNIEYYRDMQHVQKDCRDIIS